MIRATNMTKYDVDSNFIFVLLRMPFMMTSAHDVTHYIGGFSLEVALI